MLDHLVALTILHAAETTHDPKHSPRIAKSVQQVLETCAIVERLKTQLLADRSLSGVFEQLASDGASGLALFIITFEPDKSYIPLFETLGSINRLVKDWESRDACYHTQDLQETAQYYQDLLQDHLARFKLQPETAIVDNLSRIQISRGNTRPVGRLLGWDQDAGHPERSERADDGQRSQGQYSVTPTTSFGQEQSSTSTRFSDSNPFRKPTQDFPAYRHSLRSHEGELQQGIKNHRPSRVPHCAPPNNHAAPLTQQASPTFLPPSGYTHPAFQPPQRSLPSQLLPFGGWSHSESLSGTASPNAYFQTREQVEALRAPPPWSTMSHLSLQLPSTPYTMGGNPIGVRPWGTGGLGGAQYFWPHGGFPAPFQPPQPTFSRGGGTIIIGNQNTIHLTCHTRDSGNATTTTMTDSANNSSSRISNNTGTFPPF